MDEKNKMEGADYIAEKMHELYPNQEGRFWGTLMPYFLGGKDPLDGVEVYESEKGIVHWHYVTYGFSEQYTDEDGSEEDYEEDGLEYGSDMPSGFGFELTFRLKKDSDEPPIWPVNMLQNLARHVFSTGDCFDAGHHLDCNGPVALETDTKLTALGFCIDPELGEMETCNGHVKFLQAVALTKDEMYGMMHWVGDKFLEELFRFVPYGVADLGRDSLLDNMEFKQILDRGIEQDGSSTGGLYATNMKWYIDKENGRLTIELGAMHVESILTMLRGRVEKKRQFDIIDVGDEKFTTLCIEYADEPMYDDSDKDFARLKLPMDVLKEIQAIVRPHAGTYVCSSMPLQFLVLRSEIKDCNGKIVEVVE